MRRAPYYDGSRGSGRPAPPGTLPTKAPERSTTMIPNASIPRPRPPRILASLAAAGLLALAAGCAPGDGAKPAKAVTRTEKVPEAIAVEAGEVVISPLSRLYSTSATLRAEKRATVTSRTRGVVEELLVEEGDRVAEGGVLAKLEDDEQRITLERNMTIREIKKNEFERAKELHEKKVFSENEFEVIRREAEEAKHDAQMAQLELDRTTITAPFAGLVAVRHVDVGAAVNDGTAIYDIVDLDPIYADVNVPERHVTRLAPGQTVRLTADATGATATARIERIAPTVDPASGTVKVTVAVEEGTELRPGAFVRVDIVIDRHDEALVIPRSALVAEGRRWHVFRVVEPQGDTVEMLEVEIGFEEGDRVEIAGVLGSSEELRPGDRVVILGASALSNGARIRIQADENGERASPTAGEDATSRKES